MSNLKITSGARCTWWDTIDKTGRVATPSGHSLPCCPHCSGVLLEVPNEEAWFEGVDRYEAAGNPGYRALTEWARGKCFPTYGDLRAAYARSLAH